MTLLLLLTSSGKRFEVSATAAAVSDVQADLYSGTDSAQAAVPASSSFAASFEARASDLAAAAVPGVSGLSADLTHATDKAVAAVSATTSLVAVLTHATDKAADQIDVTSDLVATLRNQTSRASALVPFVSSFAAEFTSRPGDLASATIPVVADFFVRVPPRSLGGLAGAGPGRSSTGTSTGGSRGVAGTATSAPGR